MSDLDFDFLDLPSEKDDLGTISFTETVGIFQMKNPWFYIPIPNKYNETLKPFRIGNLIPIIASVGGSEWETSIAPLGESVPEYELFIPIKAQIRKNESINNGDKIKISFKIRKKNNKKE